MKIKTSTSIKKKKRKQVFNYYFSKTTYLENISSFEFLHIKNTFNLCLHV